MNGTVWQKCKTDVFWGEIAPCDHIVQIYDTDKIVLNTLEGFVSSGFKAGDSAIVIATDTHLYALNKRLRAKGFNIDHLQANNQFLPCVAEDIISEFMVDGKPDEERFMLVVKKLIKKGRGNGRKVRAYGEMVSVLWNQGYTDIAFQIEDLWNKFCSTEVFCLFCAYPQNSLLQNLSAPVNHICSAHAKIIAGNKCSATEIFYKRA